MTDKYKGMHPAYRKVKSFNLAFNPFMVGLLNLMMRLTRWNTVRKGHPQINVANLKVPSTDNHPVPVYEMTPVDAEPARPVILYYHGGAFALSWASLHWEACQTYALETGATVLLIDYRLGPRHVFPTPLDDCYRALEWVRENAAQRGYDTNRIAVAGDSAGGYFAAAVAQKACDQNIPVTSSLLIYPVLDSDCKTTSATEFTDAPLWNGVSNRRMWDMFLKNVPDGKPEPPYASPGHRSKLAGQPPTYIETAEFDPLRDEGLAYADALAAAGVQVDRNETKGTIHGYEMAQGNPVVAESMTRRCNFFKATLCN